MTYRVIQWATGEMGSDLLRQAIDHPELEVVGVRVYNTNKHGVDAGKLAGRANIGVRATTKISEILDLDADVVLHSPVYNFDQHEIDEDVMALLRSGKNVISNHAGFFYPPADPARAERLLAACMSGGATVYAAGFNPAMLNAQLIPTLSSSCSNIASIKFTELVHYYDRNRPEFVFPVVGFGSTPDKFTIDSARGKSYLKKYVETLSLVAAVMGLEVRGEPRCTSEVATATHDFEFAAGKIAKGTVSSVGWMVTLETSGPTLSYETRRTCDPKPPLPWELRRMHRIHIEGDPSFIAEIQTEDTFVRSSPYKFSPEMRARAICAPMINSIPEVVAALPGFMQPRVTAPWWRPPHTKKMI